MEKRELMHRGGEWVWMHLGLDTNLQEQYEIRIKTKLIGNYINK